MKKIAVAIAGTVASLVCLGVTPVYGAASLDEVEVLRKQAASSSATDPSKDLLRDAVGDRLVIDRMPSTSVEVGGGEVVVHADAGSPIEIKSEHGTIAISQPFAAEAAPAKNLRGGVVSHDNKNQSKTIKAVKNDGSVQLGTIIESENAPSRYTYNLTVPPGAAVESRSSIIGRRGFPTPWWPTQPIRAA
ncbi:hypothetical protein SPF06_05260 [Sinomonas sp. JGH33]|uniref:Uncharacterized protein n=1 Tax=Sinomonas terricola TaxID=3110330 RepID=A0ABU5T391_9MICC|nr:hypothetical protein [Sinomonas sp. JGH33]MEA5454128.1 hypothetical protein [Sinomonas sp. JGH33]